MQQSAKVVIRRDLAVARSSSSSSAEVATKAVEAAPAASAEPTAPENSATQSGEATCDYVLAKAKAGEIASKEAESMVGRLEGVTGGLERLVSTQ